MQHYFQATPGIYSDEFSEEDDQDFIMNSNGGSKFKALDNRRW